MLHWLVAPEPERETDNRAGTADRQVARLGKTGSSSGNNSSKSSNTNVLLWDGAWGSSRPEDVKIGNWLQKTYKSNYGASLKMTHFEYMGERKKFLTGARTGQPDAIEGLLSHLAQYAKADLIQDLTEEAKALPYFDSYDDSAINAVTYKGKIYGLPYTGNGRALVYRKDIFDKHNLEPPTTTEEFLKVGRTIKEKEEDIIPFHNCTKTGSVRAFQEWYSHMVQVADHVYKRDGDGWKVVPSAKDFGTVFDDYYYKVWASDNPIADPKQLGTGWQTNDPGYLNGKFAMIECGPWLRTWTTGDNINNSSETKKLLDEKTAIANLPHPSGGRQATYLEVKPMMANAYSKHKDLATDVVKLASSPTAIKEMKQINGFTATPVTSKVKSSIDNPNWKPFLEVFKSGVPLAKVNWGPVRESFYEYMQRVAYGKMDPHKAGQQLHDKFVSLESQI